MIQEKVLLYSMVCREKDEESTASRIGKIGRVLAEEKGTVVFWDRGGV